MNENVCEILLYNNCGHVETRQLMGINLFPFN